MNIKKIVNKFLKRTRDASCIRDINYDNLKRLLKGNLNVCLVDVRSPQEFAENKINSAINIPLYDIENKARDILLIRDALIVVYCQSGARSKKACILLARLRIYKFV